MSKADIKNLLIERMARAMLAEIELMPGGLDQFCEDLSSYPEKSLSSLAGVAFRSIPGNI